MDNDKFLENIALRLSPKVLQHISSNIYREPASAFKELASNAFDACARNFKITFIVDLHEDKNDTKARLKRIEVYDDGNGISLEDFYSIFTNIGSSKKVNDLEYDSQDKVNPEMKSRPIIGRIGIGLFSVVAASDQFEIESEKKGEPCYIAKTSLPNFARLNVTNIDLSSFEAGKANIYEKENQEESFEKSYTKITIQDFKKPFLEDIMEGFENSKIFEMSKIEEKSTENYENQFKKLLEKWNEKDKIDDLPGNIDRFLYKLSMMLPIEYLSDGPFKEYVKISGEKDATNIINHIKNKLKSYDFSVYFVLKFENKDENKKNKEFRVKLFKPISFPAERDIKKFGLDGLKPMAFVFEKKTEIINEIGEPVKLEISMYVYRQGRRIVPHELRGILFRVYDVAIGTYDYEKLRPFKASALQFQTSFEIFMDKGFQSAVNVDRESLYEASYAYRYLKRYFERILNGLSEEKFVEDELIKQDELKKEDTKSVPLKDSLNSYEKTFSEQLKKDLSTIETKPLIKELNELKESKSRRVMAKHLKEKNPILNMVNTTFNTTLKSLNQITIEETNTGQIIVKKDNQNLILKMNFKPDKRVSIPFIEILLLATINLEGDERKKFLESLEEIYRYYSD